MPIKVLELHHHGIRIDPSDDAQESAREFYSGVLGLEADSGRPNIPGVPGFWMYVGEDEKRTQIHLMGATGESPSRATRKRTRPVPTWPSPSRTSRRPGASSKRGGSATGPSGGLVGDNSDQVFVPDPFNNIIELHQIGTCRCNRVTLEAQ